MMRSLKFKVLENFLITVSILPIVMLIVNNSYVVPNNPAAAHSDIVVNYPQLPSNCHYVQNFLICSAPKVKCRTHIYLDVVSSDVHLR